MVRKLDSADSLPFDVIVLFFNWLSNASDLASASLVCRTWRVGAASRLYSNIVYAHDIARQYATRMSPFDVILAHPEYGLHVKYIAIRAAPRTATKHPPGFVMNLCWCLDLCKNLVSFTCTVPELLPSILPYVTKSKTKLTELKVAASFTRPETELLMELKSLKHLGFDSPSRIALHLLPQLISQNAETIQSLSVTNSFDLYPTHLAAMLGSLKNLKSLTVQNCIFMTHTELLRLVGRYCPNIEALSLTVYTATTSPDSLWPKLLDLKHLTIFIRQCNRDHTCDTVTSILSTATQAALESFTLRNVDRATFPPPILTELAKYHRSTIRIFNIINFALSNYLVKSCVLELPELTQLSFPLVMESDIVLEAIPRGKHLTTLVDTQSANGHFSSKSTCLSLRDVRKLFLRSPSRILRTVKLVGRTYSANWPKGDLEILCLRDRHPFPSTFEVKGGKLAPRMDLKPEPHQFRAYPAIKGVDDD